MRVVVVVVVVNGVSAKCERDTSAGEAHAMLLCTANLCLSLSHSSDLLHRAGLLHTHYISILRQGNAIALFSF